MEENSEKSAKRKIELGPIGEQLRKNLAELREVRGLSTTDLSKILDELGRPIPATSINKIESGIRRVDVGDLVALAIALGVSPARMLLSVDDRNGRKTKLTPTVEVETSDAWYWALGGGPFDDPSLENDEQKQREREQDYLTHSEPLTALRIHGAFAHRAVQSLANAVASFLNHHLYERDESPDDYDSDDSEVDFVARALSRVLFEVWEIIDRHAVGSDDDLYHLESLAEDMSRTLNKINMYARQQRASLQRIDEIERKRIEQRKQSTESSDGSR